MKFTEEFTAPPPLAPSRTALPWIETRPGLPYFVTEHGQTWTPIGHNDAVTWPELAGMFRRRDLGGVERHLQALKASGVTCIRLMLEYCQGEHRYLERPVGHFAPNMIRLWDDLFYCWSGWACMCCSPPSTPSLPGSGGGTIPTIAGMVVPAPAAAAC